VLEFECLLYPTRGQTRIQNENVSKINVSKDANMSGCST